MKDKFIECESKQGERLEIESEKAFRSEVRRVNKVYRFSSPIKMKGSANLKVKSPVRCIVIWCLLLSVARQTEAGSCREAALCCNGRDSSCVVQKTPINVINEDPNEKPCYCDHACLKLGDCCEDFKSHCGGKLTSLDDRQRLLNFKWTFRKKFLRTHVFDWISLSSARIKRRGISEFES